MDRPLRKYAVYVVGAYGIAALWTTFSFWAMVAHNPSAKSIGEAIGCPGVRVENAYSVAWAFGCIIPERRAPDDEPNAPGVVALPAAHHVGQLPEQHVRIGL